MRQDRPMADWSPLRQLLETVDDSVTVRWDDLDGLVGGLPPSSYEHIAFWHGDRSGWRGFDARDVRVGESVTFVRRGALTTSRRDGSTRPAPQPHDGVPAPDVVLVGCVKSKLDHPSPARDLYTSALFRKARAYAESTGSPWYVLSAEHGLVEPTRVIGPYERTLSKAPREYRSTWGEWVVNDLAVLLVDGLRNKVVEVHAGSAYVEAIRPRLSVEGATLVEPLAGLAIGERLAWYGRGGSMQSPGPPNFSLAEVDALTRQLQALDRAMTPSDLLARGRVGLDGPGLYSWWVDRDGAAELSSGLGEPLAPGLIYAGLAGATRTRSGRRSTNTLWGRLQGMHLGSRNEFSTFRRSLGSILAEGRGDKEIDETYLTSWMHTHLRVVAVPVDDADVLDGLETEILATLDPPLNLAKMPKSAVRSRLTKLRKVHAGGAGAGESATGGRASAAADDSPMRLQLVVPGAEWQRIEQAAAAMNVEPVEFVLQASLSSAESVLGPNTGDS